MPDVDSDRADKLPGQNAQKTKTLTSTLGLLAGWAWAILAGGGGIWLLCTQGPWPLTNGWFATASGISACPLTAWVLKKRTGNRISGWFRLAFALLFFIAGPIALLLTK